MPQTLGELRQWWIGRLNNVQTQSAWTIRSSSPIRAGVVGASSSMRQSVPSFFSTMMLEPKDSRFCHSAVVQVKISFEPAVRIVIPVRVARTDLISISVFSSPTNTVMLFPMSVLRSILLSQ